MLFQRQLDQPIDQRRQRQAACLPELGILADRSETGNRVDLVDVDFAQIGAGEEIHARHPANRERAERRDRERADALAHGARKVGGNPDLRAVRIDVLRLVAVELMAALDDRFSDSRSLGAIVAEYGAFQLAPLAGRFDQDLAIVLERVLDARLRSAGRLTLLTPIDEPSAFGLTKTG